MKASPRVHGRVERIGCYATGIFPRPLHLIDVTKAYDRKAVAENQLNEAFEETTREVVEAQTSIGFTHVTDGMLKWQDLLRPFAEYLEGAKPSSLAPRWFNNNTFYRKPCITGNPCHVTLATESVFFTQYLHRSFQRNRQKLQLHPQYAQLPKQQRSLGEVRQ